MGYKKGGDFSAESCPKTKKGGNLKALTVSQFVRLLVLLRDEEGLIAAG